LITKVKTPDTRKTGPLCKKLKKLFPDSNYTKCTREEKLAYDNWLKSLSEDQRAAHLHNRVEVEQIARVQYVKGTKRRLEHFKGQVLHPQTKEATTLNERISSVWMKQNFDPLFVQIVRKAGGKWIPVPIGDCTEDKAPKMLRTTLKMRFCQRKNATCLPSSFASSLWYLGEKLDHMGMFDAASIISAKSEDLENEDMKSILAFLRQVMAQLVPEIGIYVWYNKRRRRRPMNTLQKKELIEFLTPYPTIVVPLANDGSVSHAITVVDDLVFDSTQKYILKLGMQTLDWVCGDCGCGSIQTAIRFSIPTNTKLPSYNKNNIKVNWND
jgi:hypothetical protein